MSTRPQRIAAFVLFAAVIMFPGLGGAEPASNELQRIKDFKVWKLMNILDLNQDQSSRFMPIFNDLEKLNSSFIDSRQSILSRMDPMLENRNPDQNQIERLLNDLNREETLYLKRKDELEKELFKIISPLQRARYVRFEAEFPRLLREMVRERGMSNGTQGGEARGDNFKPRNVGPRKWN